MKLKPTLKETKLHTITARDYSGGLNKVDSELNLSSKYAVDGYNMVPDDNNALQVRWGTRLHADFTGVLTGRIVATEYYFIYILAVDSTGKIAAANAAGVITPVWNAAIAAALPGTPAPWSATPTATFAPFLGDVIIANGIDKPLLVNLSLACSYLKDLGSGSNINTPVAKFVVSHLNYVVMAGDVNKPGRLYISNAGTSGTWPGDAIPNDAITFDVDKYAPDPTGEITALASFRGRLIVFFSEFVVPVVLGKYSTAVPPVHTPTVDDIIKSYGAVSHKAVVNTGDLLLFLDFTGVSSIRQQTFTNALTPARAAPLIDSEIQKALSTISRADLQNRCFATFDKRETRIVFTIPTSASTDPNLEQKVYSLSMGQRGGKSAWAEYKGWHFQAGVSSTEARVFFARGLKVYLHGSRYEPILSDYEGVNAFDGSSSDLVDVVVNGVLCSRATLATGIRFVHELPYSELKERTKWKSLHYMTLDTQGASSFNVDLYIDELRKASAAGVGDPWSDDTYFTDGYGWISTGANAYASMNFFGGDRSVLNFTTPSSDGRPTDHMYLYAMYARFRFFKLLFRGTSYNHLRVVSVSLYYQMGSIY